MPRYPIAKNLSDRDMTKSDLIYQNVMLKLEVRQLKRELEEAKRNQTDIEDMGLFLFTAEHNEKEAS